MTDENNSEVVDTERAVWIALGDKGRTDAYIMFVPGGVIFTDRWPESGNIFIPLGPKDRAAWEKWARINNNPED